MAPIVLLFLFSLLTTGGCISNRSFTIDHQRNTFLKDGDPFQYVSGSIHYFRVRPVHWRDRLRKMKYAGLNVVTTYVDWAGHEPSPGHFDFSGQNDLQSFVSVAQEEGLLVILRVGPYMCAERDMGGLPYWLLDLKPTIRLRSDDPMYVERVSLFLTEGLFPRVKPLLYENGGPIIMAQVENEFGNYDSCDYSFTAHLRTLFTTGLSDTIQLFTTDNGNTYALRCGKIPGVYATVDFGVDGDIVSEFGAQRLFEPTGPLVVSEFYSGWLDHWGEKRHKVDAEKLAKKLDELLTIGANVNMYMFHGGTNFQLTGGANYDAGSYKSIITSYDYDAPLSEAGDMTQKYDILKEVISKHFTVSSEITTPENSTKMNYGEVTMREIGSIHDVINLHSVLSDVSITSKTPLTFEKLGIRSGIVVYKTVIDFTCSDPCVVNFGALHDFGYIYVNEIYSGVVSRSTITKAALRLKKGDNLTIVVESLGRITAGTYLNDAKGLTNNVWAGRHKVTNWTMVPLPLSDSTYISKIVHKLNILSNIRERIDYIREDGEVDNILANKLERRMVGMEEAREDGGRFSFFSGKLVVEEEPEDTFVSMTKWSKGVLWVNGFCLGRYWTTMGPQRTLYLPKDLLTQGDNVINLLEMDGVVEKCGGGVECVELVDQPDIDGDVPQY